MARSARRSAVAAGATATREDHDMTAAEDMGRLGLRAGARELCSAVCACTTIEQWVISPQPKQSSTSAIIALSSHFRPLRNLVVSVASLRSRALNYSNQRKYMRLRSFLLTFPMAFRGIFSTNVNVRGTAEQGTPIRSSTW